MKTHRTGLDTGVAHIGNLGRRTAVGLTEPEHGKSRSPTEKVTALPLVSSPDRSGERLSVRPPSSLGRVVAVTVVAFVVTLALLQWLAPSFIDGLIAMIGAGV